MIENREMPPPLATSPSVGFAFAFAKFLNAGMTAGTGEPTITLVDLIV